LSPRVVYYVIIGLLISLDRKTVWLDIDSNEFDGSIGTDVSSLVSLGAISNCDVATADCPEQVILTFFASTEFLNVKGNNIEGTIPSEIGLMTSLGEKSSSELILWYRDQYLMMWHVKEYLALNSNALDGFVPTELGLMTQLCKSLVYVLIFKLHVLTDDKKPIYILARIFFRARYQPNWATLSD
jgi:hypothetical protein